MFWLIITHNGLGELKGAIANVINDNFGNLATIKQLFNDLAPNNLGVVGFA
ncbi:MULTISPECIES: hypothetical protein [unclassified Nodularia (in: cyanobacteria)]|uniref:hypothetical protein n=1 Tax=unclassified Nodularia (in: cyanobacteria) TaxID=2656917 RepID=UPI00187F1FB9|nr:MULTISPECIES: hypothetical protein [unclassified Nodularia (in: cyanobacteria)]MBE9200625.1 hypothetical protein [Nodularia sp. LEGE 06071]MCC2694698.1 hypothetical protein [Nodularia sp. LEGE 04288]